MRWRCPWVLVEGCRPELLRGVGLSPFGRGASRPASSLSPSQSLGPAAHHGQYPVRRLAFARPLGFNARCWEGCDDRVVGVGTGIGRSTDDRCRPASPARSGGGASHNRSDDTLPPPEYEPFEDQTIEASIVVRKNIEQPNYPPLSSTGVPAERVLIVVQTAVFDPVR